MSTHPRRPARRLAAAVVPAVAFLGFGCGIGDDVTDSCFMQRAAMQDASALHTGIRSRGIARTTPTAKRAADAVARARNELAACEAGATG